MVAIVDYGMGNLHSMAKAFEYIGEDVVITSEAADLRRAERIVLPGVGSFPACVRNLAATGLVTALEDEVMRRRKPFLGVCVGMQLLADRGYEHGEHRGLGWIAGAVVPLEVGASSVRIPHTGWNEVEVLGGEGASPLTRLRSGEGFYFNHSFHFVPEDETGIAARCWHGQPVVAGLTRGNIVATQFHPEKSQRAGLRFLQEFSVWQPGTADGAPQATRTGTP